MANNREFTKRLQKILDHHDISASYFADKINVGRSSISHILSGRNKPSLDFVTKVTSAFPEIELDWLLNGKGNFPKGENFKDSPSTLSETVDKKIFKKEPIISENGSKLKKIVFFYEDGSFEVFEN